MVPQRARLFWRLDMVPQRARAVLAFGWGAVVAGRGYLSVWYGVPQRVKAVLAFGWSAWRAKASLAFKWFLFLLVFFDYFCFRMVVFLLVIRAIRAFSKIFRILNTSRENR